MPYVNIKITREGNVTADQKRQLIQGSTQLLVDVLDKDPATTHVVIDEVDMEQVAWYRRDWLRQPAARTDVGEGEFRLPTRISIARRLIDEWLDAG